MQVERYVNICGAGDDIGVESYSISFFFLYFFLYFKKSDNKMKRSLVNFFLSLFLVFLIYFLFYFFIFLSPYLLQGVVGAWSFDINPFKLGFSFLATLLS